MFTTFTLLICIGAAAVLLLFGGALLKNGKAQSVIIYCSVGLFALCILFSRDWFGPSQAIREQYSGHYKIETKGLKYPSTVIQQSQNLILVVKEDLTFELDRASPFFKTLTGVWTYESGSDFDLIKYKLDSEGLGDEMFPSNEKWNLRSQDSTHQYISFRRIH